MNKCNARQQNQGKPTMKESKWDQITSGENQSRSRNQNCDEYVHMNVCQYEWMYSTTTII